MRDPKELTRLAVSACQRLIDAGHKEEIEKGLTSLREKNNVLEGTLTVLLFLLWDILFREGDQQVLPGLFALAQVGPHFFFNQPWIQELLADWLQKGEVKTIQHVLFGTVRTRKGTRSPETALKNARRNLLVVAAVERAIMDSGGYRKALKNARQALTEKGIYLSSAAVRKIYEHGPISISPSSFLRSI
jgi:hypothetical protein